MRIPAVEIKSVSITLSITPLGKLSSASAIAVLTSCMALSLSAFSLNITMVIPRPFLAVPVTSSILSNSSISSSILVNTSSSTSSELAPGYGVIIIAKGNETSGFSCLGK